MPYDDIKQSISVVFPHSNVFSLTTSNSFSNFIAIVFQSVYVHAHAHAYASVYIPFYSHLFQHLNLSMYSWGRRFQLSLRLRTRKLCSQSQRPISSPSSSSSSLRSFGGSGSYGGNRGKDLESFLRSITSGVVVVGSTLGFWYWSSLSSPGANSLQSFADYASEDQLQKNYENKSKFLFNGNPSFSLMIYVACSLLYCISTWCSSNCNPSPWIELNVLSLHI